MLGEIRVGFVILKLMRFAAGLAAGRFVFQVSPLERRVAKAGGFVCLEGYGPFGRRALCPGRLRRSLASKGPTRRGVAMAADGEPMQSGLSSLIRSAVGATRCLLAPGQRSMLITSSGSAAAKTIPNSGQLTITRRSVSGATTSRRPLKNAASASLLKIHFQAPARGRVGQIPSPLPWRPNDQCFLRETGFQRQKPTEINQRARHWNLIPALRHDLELKPAATRGR